MLTGSCLPAGAQEPCQAQFDLVSNQFALFRISIRHDGCQVRIELRERIRQMRRCQGSIMRIASQFT